MTEIQLGQCRGRVRTHPRQLIRTREPGLGESGSESHVHLVSLERFLSFRIEYITYI